MPKNYKIIMTLYFEGFRPKEDPMTLVEEANAVLIEPPVELTDQELHEQMFYD